MLITTSRGSGLQTRQFAKGLAMGIPNAEYLPRNEKSIDEIADRSRYSGRKKLLVVHDLKGKPVQIVCISISERSWDYAFKAGISLSAQRTEKSKRKFSHLRVQAKSAKIKKLLKILGIESEDDSENLLKEQKSTMNFYSGRKETGPKFRVLGIKYEKKL